MCAIYSRAAAGLYLITFSGGKKMYFALGNLSDLTLQIKPVAPKDRVLCLVDKSEGG